MDSYLAALDYAAKLSSSGASDYRAAGRDDRVGEPLPDGDAAVRVLDLLCHGVLITDGNGTVTYMNPRAEEILGQTANVVLGRPIVESLIDANYHLGTDESARNGAGFDQFTVQLETNGLHKRAVEIRVVPLSQDPSEQRGELYEIHDVSETAHRTQQLIYEATHDPLTGLSNRRALTERLNELLKWEPTPDSETVLALLDLDGFKRINDECGHLCGDDVLREIAQILQVQTRKADMVARLGGDEFVVLLVDCGVNEARRIMETLLDAIEGYRYLSGQGEYRLSASIGVSVLDSDVTDVTQALRRADQACYRAKYAGGNCISFNHRYHDMDSMPLPQTTSPRHLAQQLFDERNYLIYRQPTYALQAAAADHRRQEILLRLIDRQGRVVQPREFLPVAHRYGFGIELDQWVLKQIGLQWSEQGGHDNRPSEYFVNLSRASLMAVGVTTDYILELLHDSGMPAETLCLDLQEQDVLDCMDQVQELTRRLRPRGVRIAIDGIGSSDELYSLTYLKDLAVDYLKLSVNCIEKADDEPMYRAFIDSLVTLSGSLGASIIGVGVEDAPMLKRCMAAQIPYVQGFALSTPEPFSPSLVRARPGMRIDNPCLA